MTITVKSKEIRVKNDRMVVESENRAELIQFIVTDPSVIEGLEDMRFYLQFRNSLGEVGMDPLTKDTGADVLTLGWLPSASFSKETGSTEIQIVGYTQSLVPTEDGTYQAGKIYFSDDGGTFLPVYPAYSAYSPKVGDEITGTVYEMAVSDDDHRWSTQKAYLYLPEDIYDEGTPIYTEEQVQSLITQLNEQVLLAETYAGDAEDYKNLAKDWAMKTGGPVEGVEMSAKVYAATSQTYATESQQWANKMDGKVLGTDYSAKYYAGKASDSATAAGLSADSAAASAAAILPVVEEIEEISGHLDDIHDVAENIDDIETVKEALGDIGKVATIDDDVAALALIDDDITDVSGIKSDVTAVAGIKDDVSAVSGIKTAVSNVSTNMSSVSAVAGNATNINTVAGISSNVTTVAGISSNVTAVAGNATNINAVAGNATNINSVAGNATNINTVAGNATNINTVATDISDVSAVASDITKVTAVADDLTNIDAVADDLTNIDNAVNYALEAEGFAVGEQNGTPVTSGSPYYHNNAKYYSQEVPALKSAIQGNTARIENLEQEHGGYQTVNYRGDNAVPTGKAKYALVESIVGKSRAWNQIIKNGDFSAVTGGKPDNWNAGIFFPSSLSASSNVMTITSGGDVANAYQAITYITGHTYLLCFDTRTDSTLSNGSSYFTSEAFHSITTTSSWSTHTAIFTATSSDKRFGVFAQGASATIQVRKVLIRDLTLIFGAGNEPSTVAECVQKCPDILKYDAYGTSIVDTTVEGVKSIGRNMFNGQWIPDKVVSLSTGEVGDMNGYSLTDYIRIEPSTSYYTKAQSGDGGKVYYDINKNFIVGYQAGVDYNWNNTSTMPANAYYVRFYHISSSLSEFCFNKSDSDNGTYTPYLTDTLTLPSSVTLRSAGSVAEVYDLESGEVTRPIKTVTYDGSNDENWASYGSVQRYYIAISGMKNVSASEVGNITCDRLITVKKSQVENYEYSISGEGATFVVHITSSQTDVASLRSWLSANPITVNYVLATPDEPTQLTPVIDNTIQTEGGGTINTIQTQTPAIDNSLDVGYLAL